MKIKKLNQSVKICMKQMKIKIRMQNEMRKMKMKMKIEEMKNKHLKNRCIIWYSTIIT